MRCRQWQFEWGRGSRGELSWRRKKGVWRWRNEYKVKVRGEGGSLVYGMMTNMIS